DRSPRQHLASRRFVQQSSLRHLHIRHIAAAKAASMAQQPTQIFDIHNMIFHGINARALRTILADFGKTVSTQQNFNGLQHWNKRKTPAGCSKRPFSKAAGESKPEAYPLGALRISMSRERCCRTFSTSC